MGCFLVGVGDLADGELARRLHQRLSSGVDGQVVRRPRYTEPPRPVALNRQVVTDRHIFLNSHVVLNRSLRRPQPSVSFRGPASSLKARTVVVGARSVTLSGDNCAVRARCRELHRLNRCLPITACGRHTSMLWCNLRDNDT